METALIHAVGEAARPLRDEPGDYDAFLDSLGSARLVLLGEATHGTHEFYRERARITQRLVSERGFTAVAVEADWPDAYRVNCYVRGLSADETAAEALGGLARFPAWMWRNAEVLELVGWLRTHNEALPQDAPRAGFYGLDLYSLRASMAAVLEYLEKSDPEAARRARYRYSCLEDFGEDPATPGYATGFGLTSTCEDEVVSQLVELVRDRERLLHGDGVLAEDEQFQAEQNARLVKDAEAYYRALYRGEVSSWNLRDAHMVDALDALLEHLGRLGTPAKVVVWAHNSHVGDARATRLGEQGELNVGQLVRERHPGESAIVGFTTYAGTVSAASAWGGDVERRHVRRALDASYEALFHEVGVPRFLLDLRDLGEAAGALRDPRLERAIGVVYKPETERVSHYFEARLPEQFDAVVHLDQTRAVEPLERTSSWDSGEPPETYPSSL